MKRTYYYYISIFTLLPLFACQKVPNEVIDDRSYINDFELYQENSKNDSRIRITSPKAIIDPSTTGIEIFDSSIDILNSNGMDVQIKSGNSTINNSTDKIRVYNNAYISLVDTKNSFITTNNFDWDLNTSKINFNSPLDINFENTKIISSNGIYNIDSSQLQIYNNIFNRTIFNKNGKPLFKIKIISEMASWLKKDNSLVFSSNGKQVETTINFLNIK